MASFRTAYVYVRNNFAGTLSESDDGFTFLYDSEYLKSDFAAAVSLTLPLKSEPYYSDMLFPFFDGLIPEGWMLNVVCKELKVKVRDRFGLLLLTCGDCIGTVTVLEDRI